MPTAHDYRSAATRLRQLSQQVDEQAIGLHGWPVTSVFGGPIAEQVDLALGSVVTQLRRASDGLLDMVMKCERRAEICVEYQRQFLEWVNLAYDPPEPPRPQKPYAWVDIDL